MTMAVMALMALAVILTCGVMLMWGYSKASRTTAPQDPQEPRNQRERQAPGRR